MPFLDARVLDTDHDGLTALRSLLETDPARKTLLRRSRKDAFKPRAQRAQAAAVSPLAIQVC